jgi:hypothetical protein
VREKYRWLVVGGWFVLREKYCWPLADNPNEQAEHLLIGIWKNKSTGHGRAHSKPS